tara:strand:+ start:401 stop:823 length:423 start_codon:yes stop_codon:yes gene_type:complete
MIDSFKLNLDDDGFVTQECPSCNKQFKVEYGKGADGPIQFCPYCDHTGEDCWWTTEQAKYIESTVISAMDSEVNSMFKDAFKDSKSIKFTPGSSSGRPAAMPQEINNDWPIVEFKSTERIKHDGSQERLRCPVTGVFLGE